MEGCNDQSQNAALARLEAAMSEVEEAMKIAKAPSISIGILHEGEVLFRRSIGLRDVHANLEANSDTSYLIGSCSKMFTSTALGILAGDEKLTWEDKIQTHLPSFDPIEDPKIGENATLLDACRHSTGLANPNAVYMGPEGTFSNSAEDHVEMLNALPTSNQSGQRFQNWWNYSNAAFGVLAQVAEAASGIKFAQFLRKRLQPLLHSDHPNPLRGIVRMWDSWWTQPISDGFENDTVYTLGWYRTTMPSGALGFTSYNPRELSEDDKSWVTEIIGRESEPRTLYGHNGIANGGVATAYVFPESHTAIVALANAAYAGDAADTASQILLQALFDLRPKVDLLQSLRNARDRIWKTHKDIVSSWESERDVSKYNSSPEDLLGSYLGLNTSHINIVPSETATAQLAVRFADNKEGECDLEPYSADMVSFLPLKREQILARGMIDWDYHKVGIFEFVKDDDGQVVGLWWQWDEVDYPGLWVKQRDGMGKEETEEVIKKFGRFRKPAEISDDTTQFADTPS